MPPALQVKRSRLRRSLLVQSWVRSDNDMALATARGALKANAIAQAEFADLLAGGTAHLDALKNSADADFNAMVVAAETRMLLVTGAINSVPKDPQSP